MVVLPHRCNPVSRLSAPQGRNLSAKAEKGKFQILQLKLEAGGGDSRHDQRGLINQMPGSIRHEQSGFDDSSLRALVESPHILIHLITRAVNTRISALSPNPDVPTTTF